MKPIEYLTSKQQLQKGKKIFNISLPNKIKHIYFSFQLKNRFLLSRGYIFRQITGLHLSTPLPKIFLHFSDQTTAEEKCNFILNKSLVKIAVLFSTRFCPKVLDVLFRQTEQVKLGFDAILYSAQLSRPQKGKHWSRSSFAKSQ